MSYSFITMLIKNAIYSCFLILFQNITQFFITIFQALGAKVWALKRTEKTGKEPYVDEIVHMDQLDLLLKNCDYVCNVLPNTEKTTNCLSGGILTNCKGKYLNFF